MSIMLFMKGMACICFRSSGEKRGVRGRGRGRRYGALVCCGVFAGVFPKQAGKVIGTVRGGI